WGLGNSARGGDSGAGLWRVEAGVQGERALALIEGQKFFRPGLHRAGDVQNVERAATQARRLGAQAAEGVHQFAAMEVRENIESALAALMEQRELGLGLLRGDVLPKDF